VLLSLLDAGETHTASQPELMLRRFDRLELPALTVVCGCGGGAPWPPCCPPCCTAPRAWCWTPTRSTSSPPTPPCKPPCASAPVPARPPCSRPTRWKPRACWAPPRPRCSRPPARRRRAGPALCLHRGAQGLRHRHRHARTGAPHQPHRQRPPGHRRHRRRAGRPARRPPGRRPGSAPAASAAVYLHGWTADQWPAGSTLTAGALAQCAGAALPPTATPIEAS
jgi:hypothetical protein